MLQAFFANRLQPADYSAAASRSPGGSKSLHKETGPRPGCTFYLGNSPGANSYARCQESRSECARETVLGSHCVSQDLHPILSPFSTCLNFPVCSRASLPEGPGGVSRDKNRGCVPKVLQRKSGCLHQPFSRLLPQLVLHHPLHPPQHSSVNSLEGSLEPLTRLQVLPVCTSQNALARRTQPCHAHPWSPRAHLQVQR